MNEQQERSAFEAWVKETRGSPWPIALDRADAGNYMYLPAIEAWAVWQARSKLAANVPADHATLLNIRVALVKGTKWCLPTAAAELRQALKDLDAMLAAAPAPEADADALRLADAIDPFTRKAAPDHLTSKVAADALRRLAFATVPAQAQQPSEPMTNIESPFNACQHREHCKGWKMVATDVVGRAKPEAQQSEGLARDYARGIPLFAAPVAATPLSTVEIMREWASANGSLVVFARAIEAAHGIKEKP